MGQQQATPQKRSELEEIQQNHPFAMTVRKPQNEKRVAFGFFLVRFFAWGWKNSFSHMMKFHCCVFISSDFTLVVRSGPIFEMRNIDGRDDVFVLFSLPGYNLSPPLKFGLESIYY
jgi:hypothetical protein